MKEKSAMQEAAEGAELSQGQVFRDFSLDSRAGEDNFEEKVVGAYQQVEERDWRLAIDLFKFINGEEQREGFVIEETFLTNPRRGFEVFKSAIIGEVKEIKFNFETENWNVMRLTVEAGQGFPEKPSNRLEAELVESERPNRWIVRVMNWTLDQEGNPISGKQIQSISTPDLENAFKWVRSGIEEVLDTYTQKLPPT